MDAAATAAFLGRIERRRTARQVFNPTLSRLTRADQQVVEELGR
jgi:hypothetical protein